MLASEATAAGCSPSLYVQHTQVTQVYSPSQPEHQPCAKATGFSRNFSSGAETSMSVVKDIGAKSAWASDWASFCLLRVILLSLVQASCTDTCNVYQLRDFLLEFLCPWHSRVPLRLTPSSSAMHNLYPSHYSLLCLFLEFWFRSPPPTHSALLPPPPFTHITILAPHALPKP
jgi:hypothetical protein